MGKTQKNPMNRGSDMREKAMAIAMKRKEEYLGARVPKALKERVIKKADEMNIPVSLLIRRLLEQTFPEGSAAPVKLDIDNVTEAAAKPVSSPKEKYADIIGWKEIEVSQDRSCERCREPLPKGSMASLGFTSTDAGYVILCPTCKSQLM